LGKTETAEELEVQVMVRSSRRFPLPSLRTAESGIVLPTASGAASGTTDIAAIDSRADAWAAGETTSIFVVVLRPSTVAMIVAFPGRNACRVPFSVTLATPGAELDHSIRRSETGVPSAASATAESFRFSPTWNEERESASFTRSTGLGGETLIAESVIGALTAAGGAGVGVSAAVDSAGATGGDIESSLSPLRRTTAKVTTPASTAAATIQGTREDRRGARPGRWIAGAWTAARGGFTGVSTDAGWAILGY
jgi:hypothetical protein